MRERAAPMTPERWNRIVWRCRRGMKELDVLLERYLERDLSSATRDEISLFAEFLELQDPELARYLLAGEPGES